MIEPVLGALSTPRRRFAHVLQSHLVVLEAAVASAPILPKRSIPPLANGESKLGAPRGARLALAPLLHRRHHSLPLSPALPALTLVVAVELGAHALDRKTADEPVWHSLCSRLRVHGSARGQDPGIVVVHWILGGAPVARVLEVHGPSRAARSHGGAVELGMEAPGDLLIRLLLRFSVVRLLGCLLRGLGRPGFGLGRWFVGLGGLSAVRAVVGPLLLDVWRRRGPKWLVEFALSLRGLEARRERGRGGEVGGGREGAGVLISEGGITRVLLGASRGRLRVRVVGVHHLGPEDLLLKARVLVDVGGGRRPGKRRGHARGRRPGLGLHREGPGFVDREPLLELVLEHGERRRNGRAARVPQLI
mmetsp:Transcript_9409/g.41259  ORF Transcript_9409/g.41259 Transcript_9409/m.41259 type:complete len:362 (-) Transcript_9409:150-1235(-)